MQNKELQAKACDKLVESFYRIS